MDKTGNLYTFDINKFVERYRLDTPYTFKDKIELYLIVLRQLAEDLNKNAPDDWPEVYPIMFFDETGWETFTDGSYITIAKGVDLDELEAFFDTVLF